MRLNISINWCQLRNAKSFKKFKNTLLQLGQRTTDLIYRIHHPSCLKLFPRLWLGLNHLKDHRFKHNFGNCINALSSCSFEVNSTKHFLPALLVLFSTPYFFLKWFKRHFTKIRTTSCRRVCQNTTLWQSNFWWKWLSKNTWNFDKVYTRLKRFSGSPL